MKAVQLVAPGTAEVLDIAEPDPDARALVRLQTVGICGTDTSIVAGKIPVDLPRTIGHEGVGIVERPGQTGSVATGQRVLIDPGISCDRCDLCRRGRPNLCRNGGLLGRDFDGLFAELAAVPEQQLLLVPDWVDADEVGLLQVLGTCVHALARAPVAPGDTAVVIGLGVAGQLLAQLLTARGAVVIGVTRSAWKRELADRLGAESTATPDEAAGVVAEMTEGRGPELVVEAVGTEDTVAQAITLAGIGATLVLYGTVTGGGGGLPYYELYYKELTLLCPRAATKADYQRAIDLVAARRIEVEPLVSSRFDLSDAVRALDAVGDGSNLKVLMTVR